MIGLLILLSLNSLLIVGFFNATKYSGWEDDDANGKVLRDESELEWKQVLWWVRYYGYQLPEFFQSAIFRCPLCMASFHSIIPFSLFIFEGGYPDYYMMLWPGYVLALSGINALTIKLTE